MITALPPVKKLRAARWRRRAFDRMPSRCVVAAARKRPETKQKLIEEYMRRFSSVAEDGRFPEPADGSAAADMLWCELAFGFSSDEYRCYGFAEKTEQERAFFLSAREAVRFSYQVNDLDAMRLFSDKGSTYDYFKDAYGREVLALRSADDLPAFGRFLSRQPIFVVKPIDGSCGRGVERIDSSSCGKSAKELFRSLLVNGAVLVEEPIVQHEATARFHPASVNTVRIITLNERDGIRTAYAFLKMGRSGSFTDNGASGGIMAGIDVASGVIVTDGVDENGARYERHPDTGEVFRGTALPDWQLLTALCVSLAERSPKVRFIGWDAAYADRGWVIVEGNGQSELIGPQAVSGHGVRREIMAYLKKNGFSTAGYRA